METPIQCLKYQLNKTEKYLERMIKSGYTGKEEWYLKYKKKADIFKRAIKILNDVSNDVSGSDDFKVNDKVKTRGDIGGF